MKSVPLDDRCMHVLSAKNTCLLLPHSFARRKRHLRHIDLCRWSWLRGPLWEGDSAFSQSWICFGCLKNSDLAVAKFRQINFCQKESQPRSFCPKSICQKSGDDRIRWNLFNDGWCAHTRKNMFDNRTESEHKRVTYILWNSPKHLRNIQFIKIVLKRQNGAFYYSFSVFPQSAKTLMEFSHFRLSKAIKNEFQKSKWFTLKTIYDEVTLKLFNFFFDKKYLGLFRSREECLLS